MPSAAVRIVGDTGQPVMLLPGGAEASDGFFPGLPEGLVADPGCRVILYAEAYADEPFVEVADRPPGVRDVRETNLCRVHVRVDERTGKVLAFGAIDNLWKGAASQAIQNLNLMLGLPEGEGIS